jgi:Zn finger protein HypA/HybF involved in hydrogenase expression
MSKKLWQVLLQSALETSDVEITCMECFNLLDQYADLLLDGTDPQEIIPTVREHLQYCPTCTHEFETLLLMIRAAAQQSGPG